jgi:hypothetical protein
MTFQVPRRSNPFENPLVQMLLHLIALGVAVASIYLALLQGTWTPIAVGFLVIATLEGVWLYFKLRR